MLNRKTEVMIEKSKLAKQDFSVLLAEGNIAFFKSCEITQVFAYNKETKSALNYYTLCCFCESDQIDEKPKFLGEPYHVNNVFNLGIQQKRVSLRDAEKTFQDLQNGSLNYDEPCDISSNMALLPKTFVSNRMFNSPAMLNDVLKPNFWGGNYVIEFFDESKKILNELDLTNESIEKIHTFIKSTLFGRIDLAKAYDRIGNVIFQFPITLFNVDSIKKDNITNVVRIRPHPLIDKERKLHIELIAKLDDVVTGFGACGANGKSQDCMFKIGDDNNLNTIVSNVENGLLYHWSEVNFIRSISGGMHVRTQFSQNRSIQIPGEIPQEIEITQQLPMNVGAAANDYFDRILKRKLNNEIVKNSGDYAVFKQGQRDDALKYIREKITSCSIRNIKEICLWDPYLRARDIIQTLYYEQTCIPFRCITQYGKSKNLENAKTNNTVKFLKRCCTWLVSFLKKRSFTFYDFKKSETQFFEQCSNNYGVKLKFLAQHGSFGWKFHDRFLIICPKDSSELPVVYSLGISVNQLGCSHHIIQKVPDSRKICKNFDDLWTALDREECVVTEFGG